MSKFLSLSHSGGALTGLVRLSASKSESNRVLMINALSGQNSQLNNLSTAHDTMIMQRLLGSRDDVLDAEDAGTVMRFLTAYLAVTNQQKVIKGTARMHQRPIGLLVEALRELGADINYIEQEGFPPLRLNGIDLSWPETAITIPGNVSSQFISALLLIGPVLPYGLQLRLTGSTSSRPYIDLTIRLMKEFGAQADWVSDTELQVEPVPYQAATYTVEADWSASSYWYSLVAISKEAEINLSGLRQNSAQGDRFIAEVMKPFGVNTRFTSDGVVLTKSASESLPEVIDCRDFPDLAPTLIVTAAALQHQVTFTGLQSLRIKETDRILALQKELAKIGAELEEQEPAVFVLKPGLPFQNSSKPVLFETYQDHRMAMAFAPLALLHPLQFNEPQVVRKSYPDFWNDLKNVGFQVDQA